MRTINSPVNTPRLIGILDGVGHRHSQQSSHTIFQARINQASKRLYGQPGPCSVMDQDPVIAGEPGLLQSI